MVGLDYGRRLVPGYFNLNISLSECQTYRDQIIELAQKYFMAFVKFPVDDKMLYSIKRVIKSDYIFNVLVVEIYRIERD